MQYDQMAQRFELSPEMRVDSYTLKNRLGAGGFGTVWSAMDSNNRIFALKFLRLYEFHLDDREEIKERFNLEFEAGLLKSPYLAAINSRGSYQGNPYIVMDFYPNGCLFDQMKNGLIPLDDVKDFGCEILLGLKTLHINKLIHRDLKPANVLLDAERNCRITDYGIAGNLNHRMTRRDNRGYAEELLGSTLFMPPEQLDEKVAFDTLGPVTDIYAFGVTMYQLFSGGQSPYGDTQNVAELLIRKKREKIVDIRKYRKDIPDLWKKAIEDCLKAEPRRRPQNTDEVLKALRYEQKPDYKSANSRVEEIKPQNSSRIDIDRDIIGLIVMEGEPDQIGRIYNLLQSLPNESGSASIGRYDPDIKNDMVIMDSRSFVSRHQAAIVKDRQRNAYILQHGQDQDITGRGPTRYIPLNGTYLNGQPVNDKGSPIAIGDLINMGDVVLKVIKKQLIY